MLNEAFKKQMLNNQDTYQAKRWEGKPLKYKFKFALANYPEMVLALFVVGVIAPGICLYKHFTFENSRNNAITKFRSKYVVVRDDHPNIDEIMKEKAFGKEFFPKY